MPASPTTDPHFRNKLTRDLNQEDAKMASTDSTVPSTTTGDSAGAHAGADVANKAKSAVRGIHGIGEAIRGNANAALDSASGDTEAVRKNEQIANKGVSEMDQAQTTGRQVGPYPGPGIKPARTGL